jgi:hypothetical protein
MAYLLVGLGAGMISGLTGFNIWEKIAYTGFMVLVMAIVDSRYFLPLNAGDDERTTVTLDGSDLDPASLKARVETLLNIKAISVKVRAVTLEPVTTKVDVTYRQKNG